VKEILGESGSISRALQKPLRWSFSRRAETLACACVFLTFLFFFLVSSSVDLTQWFGIKESPEEALGRWSPSSKLLSLARAELQPDQFYKALPYAGGLSRLRAGGQTALYSDAKRQFYDAAIAYLMEEHWRDPGRGWDITAFELSERARATDSLSLLDVQKLLDPGTRLLSYWLGKEKSFLWVVGSDSIESFELPSRRFIEGTAARAFVVLSGSRGRVARASLTSALQSLSGVLINPAAQALNARRLAVIPDGPLWSIPFAALPDQSSIPLLVNREITEISSASSLALIRKKMAGQPAQPGLVAVVADPVFGPDDPRVSDHHDIAARLEHSGRSGPSPPGTRLSRLPYSQTEAESILQLVPPARSLSALGLEANRDLVRSGALSKYRILHFATHGTADPGRPDSSSIVLSLIDKEGKRQDGYLSAAEIRSSWLPADLVVLSTCGTGFRINGQGRADLSSSFIEAGASRVLSSLWRVNDRPTAELMEHFYQGLLTQRLSPAEALREAQLWMLADPRWSSPVYWAGFVIEGEWRWSPI
jgi:CHAT domain-containing protein